MQRTIDVALQLKRDWAVYNDGELIWVSNPLNLINGPH